MSLRSLIKYIWLSARPTANHGGRIISPYSLRNASDDEKLLIEAGIARSPQDARFLLEKYGTTHAADVLKIVARRKATATARERLTMLLKRMNGHDPRDLYGRRGYDAPVIPVQYRYRGRGDR